MRIMLTSILAALLLLALPVSAQKAPQTATQFYMDYRAAFLKAQSMEPLLPYLSKDGKSQYEATPKPQRQGMFEMMKDTGAAMTSVKVVKETKKGDGYVLDLTAIDSDKKPAKGRAEIILEGGEMKLKSESWTS
jgi:hypothetical protein